MFVWGVPGGWQGLVGQGILYTDIQDVSSGQIVPGFRLNPENDEEPCEVSKQCGLLQQGARAALGSTWSLRHAPCLSLPHSFSFQEQVLEV